VVATARGKLTAIERRKPSKIVRTETRVCTTMASPIFADSSHILEGAGTRYSGMAKTRLASSHSAIAQMKVNAGTVISFSVF
jgi:hypothetical protein